MLGRTRRIPLVLALQFAAVALCLGTPDVASPGDRFTPPTFTGSDEHVQCRVVNVSGAKRTIHRYCHFTVVGTASGAIRGSMEIL